MRPDWRAGQSAHPDSSVGRGTVVRATFERAQPAAQAGSLTFNLVGGRRGRPGSSTRGNWSEAVLGASADDYRYL
ncbi:MAG: hypothetical protein JO352_14995 [Chloroflexi bacterium]|nr:hypothetical protein [Chloroflexota bacterium]